MLDAQGTTLVGDNRPGEPPINLADRDWFITQRGNTSGGLVMSQPLQRKIDGVWVVSFSRRITDAQGRFAGVGGREGDELGDGHARIVRGHHEQAATPRQRQHHSRRHVHRVVAQQPGEFLDQCGVGQGRSSVSGAVPGVSARPKSSTLTLPWPSTSTLPGFRSR